jgi:pSer/pThr/pTyr-binding forkhead associated (FHA) protein
MIMPTRLVALGGGPDILVDGALVLLGRDPGCDVRLESCRVSRIHCCLSRDRDEILVRDLGSTNGTMINGRRVESGRLRAGDELAIAHLFYRLVVAPTSMVTPLSR